MLALLFCSLFALSNAEISWSISESEEDLSRRLALQLTSSTTDVNATGCIVGGYDSSHPNKVYVGGPCNKLEVTTVNGTTTATKKAGFRYVSMEVVRAGIRKKNATLGDTDAEAKLVKVASSDFQDPVTDPKYASVATGVQVKVESYEGARIYTGQASYLAKQDGSFTKNNFAFEKTGGVVKKIELCVAPCGTPADYTSSVTCAGDACPTQAIQYKQGDYKFSVYLASKDSSDATAGNGWAAVKAKYGTGDPKQLAGDFYVDQVIDFSEMGADKLTVTKPDGTTILYKDMTAFTGTNEAAIVEVDSVKVEGDGFTADYTFPKTYNQGDWSNNGNTVPVKRTKKVKIMCVRADDATLASLMSITQAQAALKKVVLFRYQFDVTGIEGTATSGHWMTYDPTVKSGTVTSSSTATTGSGVTGGSNSLLPSCVALASAILFLLLKD